MKLKRWQAIYIPLVILRIICSLSSGYIHPDEWFQSGEVLVGHLLQRNTVRTWEFDPSFPCRSMTSIYLFNFPLFLAVKADLIDSSSFGFSVFLIQRMSFLALSFVPDFCISTLFRNLTLRQKHLALILYAGSGATLSFAFRPFSNNIESAVLFSSITILHILTSKSNPDVSRGRRGVCRNVFASRAGVCLTAMFGALCALGLFSRFTFAAFVFPSALQFLSLARMEALYTATPFKSWFKFISPCILTFSLVCLSHITLDTIVYSHMAGLQNTQSRPQSISIVPLNALMYNLRPSNLAEHGVHPRWLHLLVNAPMILGIVPWISFLSMIYNVLVHSRKSNNLQNNKNVLIHWTTDTRLMAQTVGFALLVLSIQPHQEPRFLLPLVAPVSVILGTIFGARASVFRFKYSIWIIFWLQGVLLVLLFCVLHHAGIVTSMLQWRPLQDIYRGKRTEFLFWRSFMPPTHLLLPFLRSSKEVSNVQDLASMPAQDVIWTIEEIQDTDIFLFAPFWAIWKSRDILTNVNVTIKSASKTYSTHLDLDHLPESKEMWKEGYPLKQIFAYGVWYIQR